MAVDDFYLDFARANFGDEAPGRVLARIDGVNLPEPGTWLDGPGGIKTEKAAWSNLAPRYAFVGELEALRDRIRGGGNLERFDYWLNTYRYMATLAQAGCVRGELDRAVETKDAARALEYRTQLARLWERMITLQVMAADTPGELGTLANLEQHNRKQLHFLDKHDQWLAAQSGGNLPESLKLSTVYTGPSRLVVPTVRTLVKRGESVTLKVLAVSSEPVDSVLLYWRPLGPGKFRPVKSQHVSRAVYTITLPAANEDFEYYVESRAAGGKRLVWPATAPTLNQTVVSD
jgi:hypothetical protein